MNGSSSRCERCFGSPGTGPRQPANDTIASRPNRSHNCASAIAFGQVGTYFSGAVVICMIDALWQNSPSLNALSLKIGLVDERLSEVMCVVFPWRTPC